MLSRCVVWMHQLLCVVTLVQEALGFVLCLSRPAGPASSVLRKHALCWPATMCGSCPVSRLTCITASRQPLGALLQCRKPRRQRHPQQATLQDHPGLDTTLARLPHVPDSLSLSAANRLVRKMRTAAQHSTVHTWSPTCQQPASKHCRTAAALSCSAAAAASHPAQLLHDIQHGPLPL